MPQKDKIPFAYKNNKEFVSSDKKETSFQQRVLLHRTFGIVLTPVAAYSLRA